jgi:hypothetical protein
MWELEPGAAIIEQIALPIPTGFDTSDWLDAFLDMVRWGAASMTDVRSIQTPFRASIEVEDYQLDPRVRAIQIPRVSLLISNDIVLGKTIEAGRRFWTHSAIPCEGLRRCYTAKTVYRRVRRCDTDEHRIISRYEQDGKANWINT